MTQIRSLFALVSTTMLIGCAAPGKDDLVSGGMQGTYMVSGNQGMIAQCIVSVLDHEHWDLFGMQAPVTRVMQMPDGKSTELEAGMPANASALFWMATVRQISSKQSSVALTARRDVTPSLSSHYMFDKVHRAITECDGVR